MKRYFVVIGLIVACTALPAMPGVGQSTAEHAPLTMQVTTMQVTPEEEAARKTLTTLHGILQLRNELLLNIQHQKELLKAAENEDDNENDTQAMQETLAELHERLRATENTFQSIATGIDLDTFSQKSKTEFNWQVEVHEIVGPIIDELKNLTARPREIERLRNEISAYTRQLNTINSVLDNLLLLKYYTTRQEIESLLTDVENSWIEREKEVASHVEVAEHQLAEKRNAAKSFGDSAQQFARNFFSTRGRNVVLAVLTFGGVLFLLHYGYRYLVKISPFHDGLKRTFSGRLLDVVYGISTVLGATLALIVVLYVTADWVLLGLVLFLLFGIVWAARQGLPLVWEQVKLLLNLGTVRENERVLYNGLPWKVLSLKLHTRFHNPALKGGMIRLPLRDLVGLQSRPFHKHEPWFPSQEGDWVLLDDGTFGTVTLQTPEIVQLQLLGGSQKTYPTPAFMDQNPTDLSHNFRVDVTFGVDYTHQDVSTQEIPEKLKARIQADLERTGYWTHVNTLAVEFQEAAASSLDMAIMADFSGEMAQDYEKLQRLLQRIAVDASNEHGWDIPFAQITVHQAQE